MNANDFITKDYRKKDDFVVRINKPNFQNAKNERKLNFNKGLQKKRLFSRQKTNPTCRGVASGEAGFKPNFFKGQNLLPENPATPAGRQRVQ